MIARTYFGLASWQWRGLATAPDHLASFEAGLDHCRTPTRVLDIGTGAGGSAAALAARWPSAQVIASDVSRRMLKEARRLHAAPNLRFERAPSGRLPFADDEFDLVTLHNAVPEMHELRRVLAAGGEVLTASTFSPLAERLQSVRGRWFDFGFELVEAQDVARGAFELFRLVEDPPPPPFA